MVFLQFLQFKVLLFKSGNLLDVVVLTDSKHLGLLVIVGHHLLLQGFDLLPSGVYRVLLIGLPLLKLDLVFILCLLLDFGSFVRFILVHFVCKLLLVKFFQFLVYILQLFIIVATWFYSR